MQPLSIYQLLLLGHTDDSNSITLYVIILHIFFLLRDYLLLFIFIVFEQQLYSIKYFLGF